METEEIRQDLLRRAKEMREMDPKRWVNKDPRLIMSARRGTDVFECAVLRVSYNLYGELSTRALASDSQLAVDNFLNANPMFSEADNLTYFNDYIATSPIEVAELLEKVAANL